MIFKNIFNTDFQDLISDFNTFEVEYILVGGYLVILHGYNRTTGDLDLWVNPTMENYLKIIKAFSFFGLPTEAISLDEFLDTVKNEVFTFGVSPVSIDILTSVKGLVFQEAFEQSAWYELEENLSVRGLSKSDLIKAKMASGRNKDLDDIENLT